MKKTHVDEFLEGCSDKELLFLLGYVKAQKEDELDEMIARTRTDGKLQ